MSHAVNVLIIANFHSQSRRNTDRELLRANLAFPYPPHAVPLSGTRAPAKGRTKALSPPTCSRIHAPRHLPFPLIPAVHVSSLPFVPSQGQPPAPFPTRPETDPPPPSWTPVTHPTASRGSMRLNAQSTSLSRLRYIHPLSPCPSRKSLSKGVKAGGGCSEPVVHRR